jgi:hypothetical protein
MNKAVQTDEAQRVRRPIQHPPTIEQAACDLCGETGDAANRLVFDRSHSVGIMLCAYCVSGIDDDLA